MLKQGDVITKQQLDEQYIVPIFRAANNIVPDMAFNLTSAQFVIPTEDGTLQFFGKYNTQFIAVDAGDLLLGRLYDRIDRAIGR